MDVEAVLRRQDGVIKRSQALATGLSPAMIGRRLASGRWMSLHPCVYFAMDRDLTDEALVRAALLWAGPRSTATGLTAAWWHGLCRHPPGMLDVTVPRAQCLSSAPRVRVRRRDLDDQDRSNVRGVWVTGVALTVLEAAIARDGPGPQLLDRALQRGVSFESLHEAHSRNLGRTGSRAASALLRAAADHAASEAERVAVKLLRSAGITGWVLGHQLAGYTLDIAFPQQRIAIEIDGWAWHVAPDRFHRDRKRQNTLVLAGWTVLRFTWRDLTRRPEEVITEIRTALAAHPAA